MLESEMGLTEMELPFVSGIVDNLTVEDDQAHADELNPANGTATSLRAASSARVERQENHYFIARCRLAEIRRAYPYIDRRAEWAADGDVVDNDGIHISGWDGPDVVAWMKAFKADALNQIADGTLIVPEEELDGGTTGPTST